jgi:hypothetical protein
MQRFHAATTLHVDAAVDNENEGGTLFPRHCSQFLVILLLALGTPSRCACIFGKTVVFERRNRRVPRSRLARARLLSCKRERAQTSPIGQLHVNGAVQAREEARLSSYGMQHGCTRCTAHGDSYTLPSAARAATKHPASAEAMFRNCFHLKRWKMCRNFFHLIGGTV